MRWFVDISPLSPGGDTSRFCVEAEQWQRALQSIRSLRGDTSPFSSFSIELLDEGYRAIDPTSRIRFTVQRAPDDAQIVLPADGAAAGASKPPPSSIAPRPQSRRGRTGATIPSDPVPRTTGDGPASAAVSSAAITAAAVTTAAVTTPAPTTPAPTSPAPTTPHTSGSATAANGAPADVRPGATRPMQAETAFEKMTQGISFPTSSQPRPASADASTQILPPFTIQSSREQKPTPEAPLTYREMVLVVAGGTSLSDAEAIARSQFEVVRAALAAAPKGIFITVAVFDHPFDKKPARQPLITLSFKDWRDREPQLFYPLRDGPPVRASMAPPTTKAAEARVSAPPTTPSGAPPALQESATPAAPPRPGGKTLVDATLKSTAVLPVPDVTGATPSSAEPPRAVTPDAAPPIVAVTQAVVPAAVVPAAVVPAAAVPAAAVPAGAVPAAEVPATKPAPAVAADAEPASAVVAALAPTAAPTQSSAGATPRPVAPSPPSAPESLTTVMAHPESDLEFGPDTIGTPGRPQEVAAEARTDAPTPVFTGTAVLPVPPAAVAASALHAPLAEPTPEPPPGALTPQSAETVPIVPAPAAPTALPASTPPPASLTAKKRVRGDDLIAELFEALSDLEFLGDPLEGAEFVLSTALEKIPCEAGMVSFFSLDKQEFVVVRGSPNVPRGAILSRAGEKTQLLSRAMRANQTVIVSGSPLGDIADDPRWKATGLQVSCVACVPVNSGGRYLGVLELANPLDGIPLAAADGHALTYIGQQFAEFLSRRELVLDPDRVLAQRPQRAAR